MADRRKKKILIINPNTTQAMTDALHPLIDKLGLDNTDFTYYTSPSGVPSINSSDDAILSTEASIPSLRSKLPDHDAFLVCCYSAHPLVPLLRSELQQQGLSHKPVAGIFEASVATCIQALASYESFGIVSTGAQWEGILTNAVEELLGAAGSKRFAGCETTGLNADELHSTSKVEVDRRMRDATRRLLDRGAEAICLGCAGMAGMDEVVRGACVECLGEEDGKRIRIVDGVVAGVLYLEGALRAGLQ